MTARSTTRTVAMAFVGTALLVGCEPPSLARRVAPYPMYGQSPPQMSRDSYECESWARYMAGSAGGSTAGGAVGGAAVGAATGAALGAIAGAFVGDAGTGAAIGAALGGASGGMQGAAGGAVSYDQRLLDAYGNCMLSRGYAVNGVTPSPPQASAPGDEGPRASGVEERLTRLRQLHSEGLITDREYRERRKAVLQDL